jgi:hypothetical protein
MPAERSGEGETGLQSLFLVRQAEFVVLLKIAVLLRVVPSC